jgi:hypothetical protein
MKNNKYTNEYNNNNNNNNNKKVKNKVICFLITPETYNNLLFIYFSTHILY